MGKFPQNPDGKGSLKCIQTLINEHADLLNERIAQELGFMNPMDIAWISPLKKCGYAEYCDQEFLDSLEIVRLKKLPLNEFWPPNGPHWDGLGKTGRGEVFLIEAKANIPEIVSSPSGAKDKNSKELIRKSLDETKEYLGSVSASDWASCFYQYANRLAHLYFLRKRNNVEAFLVFIYFIGDKSVNGPETKEEWLAALQVVKQHLGIDENHRLNKYIAEIFINIADMQ